MVAPAATCSSPLYHQNNTTCFLGIAKNIGHETTVSANGSSSYGANQGFLQTGLSLPMGPGMAIILLQVLEIKRHIKRFG